VAREDGASLIRVEPKNEPDAFDERCRTRGQAWLDKHPPPSDPEKKEERPPSYWLEFLPKLSEAFDARCGYLAMWISSGTVDHFASWKNNRSLAYEWSNYRYSDGPINNAKKPSWDGMLLDPFEVDDAWFEVLLPSCQLQLVEDKIPPEILPRAKFTVEKLGLQDDERIVGLRREWLRMHEEDGLSLEGLRRKAPLVAHAVERRTNQAQEAESPANPPSQLFSNSA